MITITEAQYEHPCLWFYVKMMTDRMYLMMACLPLLLGGCVGEASCDDLAEKTHIRLSGDIPEVYQTRANAAGFADGDRVGVYIVDYNEDVPGELKNDGNRADNMWLEFDAGSRSWTAAYDVYWKDRHTRVDIYGYYPYTLISDVSAQPFEVRRNQSEAAVSGELSGYEASDFLWGKTGDVAPTSDVVPILFSHRLSMIRVTIAEGTGFASGEWNDAEKSVLITGTCRVADIDMATGTAYAKGSPDGSGIIPYRQSGEWRAIVVPQAISAGTPVVSITVGGIPYKFSRDIDFTFMPSKQHNFTITVNKKPDGDFEFIPSEGGISAWDNDPSQYGGTAKEYIVINVTEAGTLDKCVKASGKELGKIRSLKVTGKINAMDFAVMNKSMTNLTSLNLKEAVIVSAYSSSGDYCIPDNAFEGKKSLISIILPDKLKSIGRKAFGDCKSLSGNISFPEGLESIAAGAFKNCTSITSISFPSTLITLGGKDGSAYYYDGAFEHCTGLCCELVIPDKIETIGVGTFRGDDGLYGQIRLPESLRFLGDAAFRGCKGISGSLKIPEGISHIPDECFWYCGFDGPLTLHDGITSIGSRAFANCDFRGELSLPYGLEVISEECFLSCKFSGRLVLPEGVRIIGKKAFAWNPRYTGVLDIPGNVISLGAGAFAECKGIEGVVIPESLETIKSEFGVDGAFEDCFGINRIVCRGIIPPFINEDFNVTGGHSVFRGVSKENFTVEVPDEAVPNYRTAPGWRDFSRISAYRNLSVEPHSVTAINTKVTRDFMLYADDEWEVEEQPGWLTLSQTSGKGETKMRLTFSRMPSGAGREGKVVFRLKGQDYRATMNVHQYDYVYDEDEIIELQKSVKGRGVNVVLLGDGYDAKDISEGKLLADMNETMEVFFAIEPYRTYREYFNVYTGIAVSPESGVGNANTIVDNRFGTSAKRGVLSGAEDEILKYSCRMPFVNLDNLGQTLIIIVPNTSDYGGVTSLYDEGTAISYCPRRDDDYPYDFRGIVQHEAGGHGFGKLGDESVWHNAFIDACVCSCCAHVTEINAAQAKGWYQNISLTAREDIVPWRHFIDNGRYRKLVGIYEGASGHNRGVWRSEYNSCMNNDVPYYNTISREVIVKRIMQYAGEEYSFEAFVANDKVDNEQEAMKKGPMMGGKYTVRDWGKAEHISPVFMGKWNSEDK